MENYGPQKWSVVAERIKGRSGKSCRLRWVESMLAGRLPALSADSLTGSQMVEPPESSGPEGAVQ